LATRNILTEGDRGLTKKSRAVTDFNNRLHVLLDDMRETLIEADGLGLAAPQVGVLRRAVLIVDTGIETEFIDDQIIELINPTILSCNDEQTGSEGCLSMPGVYGIVTRPDTVKIKADDRYGNTFEYEGTGITARAICHEIDHLEGVLFASRAERLLTEEELAEMKAQSLAEAEADDFNDSNHHKTDDQTGKTE